MQIFEEDLKNLEEKEEKKPKKRRRFPKEFLLIGVAFALFVAFLLKGKREVVIGTDVETQKKLMSEVLETQREINKELLKEIKALREEITKIKEERKREERREVPRKTKKEKVPKEELKDLLRNRPKGGEWKGGSLQIIPPQDQAPPSPPPLRRIDEEKDKKRTSKKSERKVVKTSTKEETTNKKKVFLPAGTVVKGRILNAFPAPVGGKKFPAVLIRLEGDGKLPNKVRFPLRDCVVLALAEGTWALERAKLQAKKLSCVLKNGKVIERNVNGFIVSAEDGIEGVKGKFLQINRKQILTYLGATTLSGFFSALQYAQTQRYTTVWGTTRDVDDEFLYALYGSMAQTWNEFAKWYLEQAKEVVPVVFVPAGKPVFITFLEGFSLGVSVDEFKNSS